ncbi:MAG: response regulator transcription factor [Bryobacterales bacterium]|nr:response regulator transcription factor [Bryobacterales bacterium]MEB2359711.1 response regulator transcription factor [Bryobacterales bacterium]
MTNTYITRTVGICESQPITAEGLKSLLGQLPQFQFAGAAGSLEAASELVAKKAPEILILDKTFGVQPLLHWMLQNNIAGRTAAVVVWGVSITESEALRYVQAGAKGIMRKTADLNSIAACLRAVSAGTNWMEDAVFRELPRRERHGRTDLTPREAQVLELVEQGLKNKEIARELGIRPGTVKIHLKHIFEKTGVKGRYGLALSGLKRAIAPPTAAPAAGNSFH